MDNIDKRKISILIPYKRIQDQIFVFLQKRSIDAKRLPGWFGFWGGGKENNETPDETLRREIKEELDLNLEGHSYFGKYEFYKSVKDFYFLEVGEDFESKIKVLEGDYGKFFSLSEIMSEEKLILEDKTVLDDFYKVIDK